MTKEDYIKIASGTIKEFPPCANPIERLEMFLDMRDELIAVRQLLAEYQEGRFDQGRLQ